MQREHGSYAGYPDDGGSDLWNVASAQDLALLLASYNSQSSGDTSGSLGQWMQSIGFTDVGSCGNACCSWQHTLCGTDLQPWLDAELTPPATS